jgi:hypothetical protein
VLCKKKEIKRMEKDHPWLIITTIFTVMIAVLSYLLLAAAQHWLPFRDSASSSAAGSSAVPASYQGTYSGDLGVPGYASLSIGLTLQSGSQGADVGELTSSTAGCQVALYLDGGSGPIDLRLVVANPQGACGLLSYIKYAQVTLNSNDSVDLAFELAGYSQSFTLARVSG